MFCWQSMSCVVGAYVPCVRNLTVKALYCWLTRWFSIQRNLTGIGIHVFRRHTIDFRVETRETRRVYGYVKFDKSTHFNGSYANLETLAIFDIEGQFTKLNRFLEWFVAQNGNEIKWSSFYEVRCLLYFCWCICIKPVSWSVFSLKYPLEQPHFQRRLYSCTKNSRPTWCILLLIIIMQPHRRLAFYCRPFVVYM